MGSFAPQEGSPFPVWRRHTHAGSNCSIHASRKGRSTSQTRSVCRTAQGSLGYLFDIFHELLECGTVG